MLKNLIPSLPELGKIKIGFRGAEITSKGGKTFRQPERIDHYLITSNARDDEGNYVLDEELMNNLKKEGSGAKLDSKGNIVGIPIRLLYNSIDLNFNTRVACYVSGKNVCSGDGETAKTRDGRDVKCPCEKLEPTYQGKEKCKFLGKLYCIIEGTTAVGACHTLHTTSYNTVKSILGGLSFIQAAAGGQLAFLPLLLVLSPKTTVVPTTGAITTVHVSSIVYNGNINELRQAALGMAKERATYMIEMDQVEESAKQLMATVVESDEEQKEVNEEFYPDSIDLPVVDAEVIAAIQEDNAKREEKKVEPKKEPEPEPEKEIDLSTLKGPVPITEDQVKEVKKLKKKLGIKKPEWLKLIGGIVSGVESVMDFTTDEAGLLIEELLKMNKKASTVEPETKPEPEPEKEVAETKKVAESESTATGPMTDEQKREIISLKKRCGITDKATWDEVVSDVFPGVTSVLGFTEAEADKFINVLKESDDIPF